VAADDCGVELDASWRRTDKSSSSLTYRSGRNASIPFGDGLDVMTLLPEIRVVDGLAKTSFHDSPGVILVAARGEIQIMLLSPPPLGRFATSEKKNDVDTIGVDVLLKPPLALGEPKPGLKMCPGEDSHARTLDVSNAPDLDSVTPKSVVKSVGVVAMKDLGSDDFGDTGGGSFVPVVVVGVVFVN
jgi:hypothetical protein